jgi:membrane-associated phospholipid phosphatase
MKKNFPRLHRHLAARFSPTEVLGLHLTVGIVVMLAFAWTFGHIASAVMTDAGVVRFDARIAHWFNQRWQSAWTPYMLVITHWHRPVGVLVMAALLGGWMWRRRAFYWLLALLLSVPGGMLLNVLLKYTFQRARPSFDDPLITLATYSFPSGHTSGATFFYGLLAAWLVCAYRGWGVRVFAVLLAVCMVGLVALSRVYLGAHYLSDVLAGVAEGGAWLAVCITAVSTLRRSRAARANQQNGG